ncbi:hypothetical protein, partial [Escherichia coli]|uniref:hypothetical protein n=1 Tax=Escherichia coli TaxID=562 RepID=UPI00197AA7FC
FSWKIRAALCAPGKAPRWQAQKKCPLSGGQNNDLRHIILITGHSSMPIFNLAIFHFVHNIVIYHIHE